MPPGHSSATVEPASPGHWWRPPGGGGGRKPGSGGLRKRSGGVLHSVVGVPQIVEWITEGTLQFREVLEGVAFNLKIILDAFNESPSSPHSLAPSSSKPKQRIEKIRLIGGGARSPVWQQILADVWGIPISLPDLLTEATSWGAAVAGGVGIGLYPDWSIAKTQTRISKIIEPQPKHVTRYAELYALFKQSYLALEPIYNQLGHLS